MDTVWGDLLFFVNFCMDFQCLFLTAKLLHRPFCLWRAALASAAGALYAVAALFMAVPGVVAFGCDLAVCLLMCTLTFWPKKGNTASVFLPFLVYFGVSFAVGGAMSGIGALLSKLELPLAVSGDEISGGAFFFLATAGGLCTFLWGRVSRRRAGQARARLRVELEGREARLLAMVDTGNLLRDPVSGRPVAIVAKGVLAPLFTPAMQGAFGGMGGVGALGHAEARRVRLVPTHSVTGTGLLVALAPDRVWLDMGRGEVEVELLLAEGELNMGLDECQALLPAELIRGI